MPPPAPSEPVTSDDAASRPLTAVTSPDHLAPPVPGPSAGQPSWARLIRHARCADAGLDPDQWFPVSAEADKARHEAAAAIAICSSCLVRSGCLALSLQHWDIGQHGVWGAWSQPNAPSCAAGLPQITTDAAVR
jgi:hypothetical protein